MAIWRVGCSLLRFHWSVFYDDFFSVTEVDSDKHCELCISGLFALLGWWISDDKELEFSHTARVLGVSICVMSEKVFQIANTDEPKAELVETISALLHAGKFGRKDLTSLRGRLHFAEGQLFGRRCFKHMKVISDRASAERAGPVDHELKQALLHMRDRVIQGKPRLVKSRLANVWHVYTDASFEPSKTNYECGLGGVLVSPDGKAIRCFGAVFGREELSLLMGSGLSNPISLLEGLAVAAALDLWTGLLEGFELVCFVDNEGSVR